MTAKRIFSLPARMIMAVTLSSVTLLLHPYGTLVMAFAVAGITANIWLGQPLPSIGANKSSMRFMWTWSAVSLCLIVVGHVLIAGMAQRKGHPIVALLDRLADPQSGLRFASCIQKQIAQLDESRGPALRPVYLYFTVLATYVPLIAALVIRPLPIWSHDVPGAPLPGFIKDGSWRWRTGLLVPLAASMALYLPSQIRLCEILEPGYYEYWLTDFLSHGRFANLTLYLVPVSTMLALVMLWAVVGHVHAVIHTK